MLVSWVQGWELRTAVVAAAVDFRREIRPEQAYRKRVEEVRGGDTPGRQRLLLPLPPRLLRLSCCSETDLRHREVVAGLAQDWGSLEDAVVAAVGS